MTGHLTKLLETAQFGLMSNGLCVLRSKVRGRGDHHRQCCFV
jgi:hypothetical protein